MASTGQLSSMDAAFLYYERPVQRLHVGSLSLLDGPVPYDAFTDLMVQRLAALPRYRQRPVRPVLDWALPTWQTCRVSIPAITSGMWACRRQAVMPSCTRSSTS